MLKFIVGRTSMKFFDRLVVVALLIGVWALVLKPGDTNAHHSGSSVSCYLVGVAYGSVSGEDVEVYEFGGVSVDCSVD